MITRGDVYYADFGKSIGSEQNGLRPIIVIQNDLGNLYSPTTVVALVTSRQKQMLPTHVHITDKGAGLSDNSIVMLEQIRTIDKQRLGEMLGHVSDKTMELIEDAVLYSLGIVK